MRYFVLIFLSFILISCASWHRNQHDVYQAQVVKPIKVPSGLSSSAIKNRYHAPTTRSTIKKPVNLMPPDMR